MDNQRESGRIWELEARQLAIWGPPLISKTTEDGRLDPMPWEPYGNTKLGFNNVILCTPPR